MGQVTFQIPGTKIDQEATRKRVEERLETARIFRDIGFVQRETKMTPSYAPRFHGNTNAISKPVEDVAVWNVDTEDLDQKRAQEVEIALRRLYKTESDIIRTRYLDPDAQGCDFLAAIELSMTDRTYRRHKAEALRKLARILRLTVYLEPVSEAV
ncbi:MULTISPECIES: ArpU family phage packaging/lysis transcriptional regulator [Paenibacillus]|uniref:ArpU family phage packaging/lysis transcriptional regulator n=1 Tax=Paenibacillus TaxID=44249 RepID=UPI0022B8ED29|nr:ArpU family phage packaging/lysis transcriptional regulator [Paenibacillus caseinilyticus]MCZ8520153.1 ArpU family transcriptional regulator [Paenibacillus caseinilyticus]